jgi:YVTN family beta-propeller protein
MNIATLRRVSFMLASVITAFSCSAQPNVVDVPYTGPAAYPSTRAPVALPSGAFAVVTNSGDDSLSLIDLNTDSVFATLQIGRNPIEIDGPHHAIVDRTTGRIFTPFAYPDQAPTLSSPHANHGFEFRPGYLQAIALRDGAPLFGVPLDNSPGDIALTPDKSAVVVSHFDLRKATDLTRPFVERRSALVYMKLQDSAPYYQFPVRIPLCVAAHGMTFAPGSDNTVYVACYGEDVIAKYTIGAAAATVTRTPIGPSAAEGSVVYGPYALAPNRGATLLASAQLESKDVRFYALPNLQLSGASVAVGGAALLPAWSADGEQLAVPTQSPAKVIIVDIAARNIRRERVFAAGECDNPHEVAYSADQRKLYVVCEGDRKSKSHVAVLDAATLLTLTTIGVGVYPDKFVVVGAAE